MDTTHSTESGLREQVIEHLFVGELLRALWCRDRRDIEVLRGEVDRAGYDLVMEVGGVMRHIQLKSSFRGSKTARVGINVNLAQKPSGCVVWVYFDPESLSLGPFLWFGAEPGHPLPPLGVRVGKHTKGDRLGNKAERANVRVLNKGEFSRVESTAELIEKLFGSK